MRRDWDRRARENARHYIVTGQERWSDAEFFESGRVTLQEEVLNDLTNICQGRDPRQMKVLEIGCGAGRVTRAFAETFGEVTGVDISPEMIARARAGLADVPNASFVCNNGRDLSVLRRRWWERLGSGETPRFDFAFSFMVFQHIPSREIIENYVRDTGRLLHPGALFKFQVQGCPRVETDDSWAGVPFSVADAQGMAERCGFEMRYHAGAGDQYFWLWFFKKRTLR